MKSKRSGSETRPGVIRAIRLHPEVWAAIDASAQRAGKTVTGFIRDKVMTNLYVATKLERYEALVGDTRIPRVAVHGVPATSEEIETGADLGGRSPVRIDTVFAKDLYSDKEGNDWATLGDCEVMLLGGHAEVVRSLEGLSA
jgi:hypothetical protein